VCPQGPTIRSATATQVTFSCPASGVGVFQPSQDTLTAAARLLAGKPVAEAQTLLMQQAGFSQARLTIDPVTTTVLPSDPSQIAIIVVGVSPTS
jgi:hypothetical protein